MTNEMSNELRRCIGLLGKRRAMSSVWGCRAYRPSPRWKTRPFGGTSCTSFMKRLLNSRKAHAGTLSFRFAFPRRRLSKTRARSSCAFAPSRGLRERNADGVDFRAYACARGFRQFRPGNATSAPAGVSCPPRFGGHPEGPGRSCASLGGDERERIDSGFVDGLEGSRRDVELVCRSAIPRKGFVLDRVCPCERRSSLRRSPRQRTVHRVVVHRAQTSPT